MGKCNKFNPNMFYGNLSWYFVTLWVNISIKFSFPYYFNGWIIEKLSSKHSNNRNKIITICMNVEGCEWWKFNNANIGKWNDILWFRIYGLYGWNAHDIWLMDISHVLFCRHWMISGIIITPLFSVTIHSQIILNIYK